MKVLQLCPTYFANESFIGGAERYVHELAKAMSRKAEVVYLSFGDQPSLVKDETLTVQRIRRNPFSRNHPAHPLSLDFISKIRWADIVHCHQVYNIGTDGGVILGKLFRKKIFISDLGGADPYALSYHIPLIRQADAMLLISEYSRKLWQAQSARRRPVKLEVIYGGVDTKRFYPVGRKRSGEILFVGRILPHKGIDYLIEAINGTLSLNVVGQVYDQRYFEFLRAKVGDKQIRFHTSLADPALLHMYREALVTVQPSVYENCFGGRSEIPELLGLAVLESMASETPVIVTEVASLPELVEDGVTGFVVPPNNPRAIREKIDYLRQHPEAAAEMGKRGRETVIRRFTWDAVVDRCLKHYESFMAGKQP